jgi:hypothetical protein
MGDYCKKCRKEIAPSLLEMIETLRDRLWELEENKIYSSKAIHTADPDYDCFTDEDQQLLDAVMDKLGDLEGYYKSCCYKMKAAYETLNRWKHEENR